MHSVKDLRPLSNKTRGQSQTHYLRITHHLSLQLFAFIKRGVNYVQVMFHKLCKDLLNVIRTLFTSSQTGGRVSSLVECWPCCLAWCSRRFDPPLGRIFSGEGMFPFELTWVLTPFPKNSLGWEYKPRSSLCTHAFHCTDSKDPDIHVLDRWIPATKTHPACTIHEDGMWPVWLD